MLSALTKTIEKHSIGIKEYDSFTLNYYLHQRLELQELDGKQHYEMMMRILTNTTNANDEKYREIALYHYNQRTIYILHDLGLDPMNDDWLAICLMKYLFA